MAEASRSGGSIAPLDTRRRARAESRATAFFMLSTAAALALVVVYWRGGQPQLEGTFLALITGGIGAAIVSWAKHAMPHHEVVEQRTPITSSDEDVAAFTAEFELGAEGIGRRRMLLVAASALTFGWMHLIFRNPLAVALTLVGGYFFAQTYAHTRSLRLPTQRGLTPVPPHAPGEPPPPAPASGG